METVTRGQRPHRSRDHDPPVTRPPTKCNRTRAFRVGPPFHPASRRQVMAQASYKPDYTSGGTTSGTSSTTSADIKDRASEQMDKAKSQVERVAHQASQQASEMSENMRVVA